LARSLDLALTSAEAEKGARSNNPDAIDLTMQGWALFWRDLPKPPNERRESVQQARDLFNRALAINPNDADALAGSAMTYYEEDFNGWTDSKTDFEAKILGQADRAIALDPNNARAYLPKALYLSVLSGRYTEALGVANAGLAINPNFVLLFGPRIIAENALGRFEQAKADAEWVMRLSPRDPFLGLFHIFVGQAETSLGHFDAAIDEFHKAIDSGFRPFFAYCDLAAAYALAGRMEEAKTALADARRLNPAITIKWMKERTPNFPAVFEGLRKAGLPEE
jgi:tetratricopeptide (TPR) repeat protein